MTPSSWAKPLGQDDLVDLAKRDPHAYAEHLQAHDEMVAAEGRRQEAEVARQNAEKEERNYQILFDAQREADALHKQILETSIDRGRFMKSRTVPQSIAAYLSVIVGGLVQARKGGPNIGLEMLDKEIDRDIAEQESNLANKRNALTDLRASGMSRFQAQQAYRAAWYARAKEELLTKMQDFDPQGSTAINGAKQALEFDARVAQAAELARRDKLKEVVAVRKADDEHREAMDKHLAEQKKLGTLMGGGGAGVGVSAVKPGNLSTDDVRAQIGDPKFPVPDVPGGYTPARAKQMVELAKSGREVRQFESEQDRKLGVLDPAGTPLMAKAGGFFHARDEDEAKALSSQIYDTGEAIRLMDDVLRLRQRAGWEPDVMQSDEWLKVQQSWAKLILKTKNIEQLGALSGSDIELVTKALGSKDPTGFRDNSAGIESARRNAAIGLSGKLRSRGVADQSIPQFGDPPKLSKPNAEERAFMDLAKKPAISVDKADLQATKILKQYQTEDAWSKLTPEQQAAVRAEKKRLVANFKDITPDQLVGIEKLGRDAQGNSEAAGGARAQLETMKQPGGGQTEAIRKAAEDALAGNFHNYGVPFVAETAPAREPGVTTNAPVNLSNFGGK